MDCPVLVAILDFQEYLDFQAGQANRVFLAILVSPGIQVFQGNQVLAGIQAFLDGPGNLGTLGTLVVA